MGACTAWVLSSMLVAEIPAMSTSNRFSVGLYSVCVKAPVVRNVTVATLPREETCTCVNCPSIAAAASIVLMAHSMESIPTSCINFSFILFLLTLPAVFRCVAASLTQPRKELAPRLSAVTATAPWVRPELSTNVCCTPSTTLLLTYWNTLLLEHPLSHNRSIDGLDHLALAVVSEVIQVMLLEND